MENFKAQLKSVIRWLGTVVSTGIGGALSTGIVAIVVLLIKRNWATDAWHGVGRAWHWFGRDTSVPHWLAIALVLFTAVTLTRILLRSWQARSAEADPDIASASVDDAEAWREALVRLTDAFLTRRAEHPDEGVPFDQDWLREYRELRRETVDSYRLVARAFRKWIRSIPPEYLNEYRFEPVWHEIDSGPDETPEGLVEKLWMPLSLPEAIEFWKEWDHFSVQRLISERVELVDSFIRRLRNPIPANEFAIPLRFRMRRWARRKWRRFGGRSDPVRNAVANEDELRR